MIKTRQRDQEEQERAWRRQDELRRDAEKKADQEKLAHVAILNQPRKALLTQVDRTLEDRKFVPDPHAIVQKFNATKFSTFSCAAAVEVEEGNLGFSLHHKLSTCGKGTVPPEVATALVESVRLDKKVTMKERNFQVAGSKEDGYLYVVNLHSDRSNGMAAVALLVTGVKFSLAQVVASYEEEQVPIYEDKVVREKVFSGGHYTDPKYEKRKRPVKVSSGGWFRSAQWRDEEELIKVQDSQWVPEERWETKTIKVVKEYGIKRIPVFSQNALPPGVTMKELETSMELLVSEEAKRLLVQ